MLRRITMAAALLAIWSSPSPAEVIRVARFSHSDISGWSERKFKGKTDYGFADGALKATSFKGASARIKKITVDTKAYPLLSWSWRVERTLKGEDVTVKNGDDFAARVYVIFPRTFFWRMRAINYVWSAKMAKGSHAPSPYTANAVTVAVESGDARAGEWLFEERNIHEDYKRIFGEEPPELGGIAVMTDTDDTGGEATAWYGDITLRSR